MSTTTMSTTSQSTDWTSWLKRWDAQQTGYLPEREARFDVMLTALEVLLPEEFVAVDLCSGPGSISQRLLQKFPQARSVAVDLDPVLLAMGQGALGTMNGRLRWVDADVGDPAWVEKVGESQVDAVLSTTALHWLRTPDLVRVYHELGQLIRPGGLFLNGDNFLPYRTFVQKECPVM
ncbi:MAG: class I SAM-dependent methyltransferase [Chloroflexota bacterium]